VAEKLTGDLTELVSVRKTPQPSGTGPRLTRKLRDDQTRLAALVDERQRQQSSIEKDMETEGARAITLSGRSKPPGPDRQDGAGPQERAKAAETASLQGGPPPSTASPIWGR